MTEYKARGERLRPYSLRDTFSIRTHVIVKDNTLIAAAMGHTIEVHHRSYRTTEGRSVQKPSPKRTNGTPSEKQKRTRQYFGQCVRVSPVSKRKNCCDIQKLGQDYR